MGREGRAACAVEVKGVHGVAVQRDERAVGLVCPCCSRGEASRKIPNTWEALAYGVDEVVLARRLNLYMVEAVA